jgi:hypothetical protein
MVNAAVSAILPYLDDSTEFWGNRLYPMARAAIEAALAPPKILPLESSQAIAKSRSGYARLTYLVDEALIKAAVFMVICTVKVLALVVG